MKYPTHIRRILSGAWLYAALSCTASAQTPPAGTHGYLGLPNSGIIHFFGNVLDIACTARVSTLSSTGPADQGPTGYVVLPPRMVTDFPTVGSVSGSSLFQLSMGACVKRSDFIDLSTLPQKVWPYFFAGHADPATGLLRNIPGIGQAKGIALQLYGLWPGSSTLVPFKVYQGATPFGGDGPVFNLITFLGAPMAYAVSYIRTGAISPGAVRSNVDYIIYYQ